MVDADERHLDGEPAPAPPAAAARAAPALRLVVPTLREAYGVDAFLAALLPVAREVGAEVLVVDDDSEDGTAACVFAVNMKNAPVAVSLNLAGTAAPWRLEAAYAFRDRLDRRQLDVQNHWTAPDRVGIFPLEFRGNVVELPAFSATAIECAARP